MQKNAGCFGNIQKSIGWKIWVKHIYLYLNTI